MYIAFLCQCFPSPECRERHSVRPFRSIIGKNTLPGLKGVSRLMGWTASHQSGRVSPMARTASPSAVMPTQQGTSAFPSTASRGISAVESEPGLSAGIDEPTSSAMDAKPLMSKTTPRSGDLVGSLFLWRWCLCASKPLVHAADFAAESSTNTEMMKKDKYGGNTTQMHVEEVLPLTTNSITTDANDEGSTHNKKPNKPKPKLQRRASSFHLLGKSSGLLTSTRDACAISIKNEANRNSPSGEVTRIGLVTENKPGLLSTVVALFSSFNLAVESAEVKSLKGNRNKVDDIFLVYDFDTGKGLAEDLFESLAESIRATVSVRLRQNDIHVDPSLTVKAPVGNVTLVFTDVESSTMLWDELPASVIEDALEVHNNVVRKLLQKYMGYEVKTEGDGFMLAFDSAQRALEFALALQVDLLSAKWPDELQMHSATETVLDAIGVPMWRGLRVRAGMHTGTAIVRPDVRTMLCDYFGPVVNCAARISSLAVGGEVLLSHATMTSLDTANIDDDSEFSIFDDVQTTCLGSQKIRGISEPVVVHRAWLRNDGALSERAGQFGTLESRNDKSPINIKRRLSLGELNRSSSVDSFDWTTPNNSVRGGDAYYSLFSPEAMEAAFDKSDSSSPVVGDDSARAGEPKPKFIRTLNNHNPDDGSLEEIP